MTGPFRRFLPGLLAAVVLAAGCTIGPDGDAGSPVEPDSTGTASTAVAGSTGDAEPSTVSGPPTPADRACYQLTPAQAVAPTSEVPAVDCGDRHTARTFAVGQLDTVVDGHLLAVDADRVQRQVARACPQRFAEFVGGDREARRLTMLRPVWFTPTLAESDAGANWFRCDVIAVARDRRLEPLTGRLEGVLSRPEGRDRYAVCGTAAPGSPSFDRVVCTAQHSWRAIRTVDVPGSTYPGPQAARAAGQRVCEAAGRARAEDPLEFRWGYEWPTPAQWRRGQTWGTCWIPD